MPVREWTTKDDFYRCTTSQCTISESGDVSIKDIDDYKEAIEGDGTTSIFVSKIPIDSIVSIEGGSIDHFVSSTGEVVLTSILGEGEFVSIEYNYEPAYAEIISPEIYLSDKLHHFGDLATSITGSGYSVYYRLYENQEWSDWIDCTVPEQYAEFLLSITPDKINTEYDIDSIVNIYTENDYRYSILVQAITDEGTVNLAQVDHDSSNVIDYTSDAEVKDNHIFLSNKLNKNNTNVIVIYNPKNYVINKPAQYLQWKVVLTGLDSPIVHNISLSYRLDFIYKMVNYFPMQYRRL